MKAIAESTGRALAKIKADALAKGDLGLVAQESRTNQRTLVSFARLTVTKVYSTLHEIALMSGNSVMTRKIGKIKSLLVAGCEMEPCYIIRYGKGRGSGGASELERQWLSEREEIDTLTQWANNCCVGRWVGSCALDWRKRVFLLLWDAQWLSPHLEKVLFLSLPFTSTVHHD